MWNQLCDDEHDAQVMTLMNRVIVGISVCFLAFGGFAISTRFGHPAPPTSVAYGTEQAHHDAAVFGD
jgi:hypothetical protein